MWVDSATTSGEESEKLEDSWLDDKNAIAEYFTRVRMVGNWILCLCKLVLRNSILYVETS